MKILMIFLLACSPLFAKWETLNEQGLLAQATEIVVADFVKVEKENEATHHAISRVLECWKGSAEGTIKLKGAAGIICAPIVDFRSFKKGRYLLVLIKEGENYDPFNGAFSVVKITNGKLRWFEKDGSPHGRKRVMRILEEVKEQTLGVMKTQEIAAGRKAAEADLSKGEVRYGLVGQPGSFDEKIKEKALADFGITVVSYGCVGPPNRSHFEGYQEAVVVFLTKKYGEDPIVRLQRELLEKLD